MSARQYSAALPILFLAISASLWFLLSPGLFDLHQPISYSGDGLSHGFLVKTIIDVGWTPVHTPWVGAPFGSDLFDYPFSDGLNFLLIRVLALFSSDWVTVANLFYLAGFYLSGLSAYVVFRHLGVVSTLAVAGALLFALVPYHWLRSSQLLLASYATVPLGVWLAFIAWRVPRAQPYRAREYLCCALLVLAVGSGGAYYAYFSAFLVAAAGASRALATRSMRVAVRAFLIAGAITITVAANVAPSLIYRAAHGSNPQVATRPASESETYGLRLTQLLLPNIKHRVAVMRHAAQRYVTSMPATTAFDSASLGVAGTAGLVILLVVTLRRLAGGGGTDSTLSFLAVLAVTSFLLGTVGGAGSLIAHFVTPIIRGYNRISVCIGFIALAALLVACQSMFGRIAQSSRAAAITVFAIALGLLGALDQTPFAYSVGQNPGFSSDRAFVHDAQAQLPKGTMVWQMPYLPFPEAGNVNELQNYGPLRGYLNSTLLRWSYGAMKGRDADRWIRALAAHPVDEQLDLAARSGFGAVYVDRRGYSDHGVALERILRAKLGAPIADSQDGMLVMYRMQVAGSSPLSFEDLLVPIDTPIRFDLPMLSNLVADVSGVSGPEPWGRWTDGPVARIALSQDLPPHFLLEIVTAIAMPTSEEVDIGIRVGDIQHKFRIDAGHSTAEVRFDIPAPANVIEIIVPNPRSPRELGMNRDERKLGIGLKSITVRPQR